ncbi:MAG: hypothetical protein QXR73_04040 [Candidatus Micrarchaeaceae archaeon]
MNMNDEDGRLPDCIICGNKMVEIRGCHYKCMNCGKEIDCSDHF